jgi:hypothetical protein
MHDSRETWYLPRGIGGRWAEDYEHDRPGSPGLLPGIRASQIDPRMALNTGEWSDSRHFCGSVLPNSSIFSKLLRNRPSGTPALATYSDWSALRRLARNGLGVREAGFWPADLYSPMFRIARDHEFP